MQVIVSTQLQEEYAEVLSSLPAHDERTPEFALALAEQILPHVPSPGLSEAQAAVEALRSYASGTEMPVGELCWRAEALTRSSSCAQQSLGWACQLDLVRAAATAETACGASEVFRLIASRVYSLGAEPTSFATEVLGLGAGMVQAALAGKAYCRCLSALGEVPQHLRVALRRHALTGVDHHLLYDLAMLAAYSLRRDFTDAQAELVYQLYVDGAGAGDALEMATALA